MLSSFKLAFQNVAPLVLSCGSSQSFPGCPIQLPGSNGQVQGQECSFHNWALWLCNVFAMISAKINTLPISLWLGLLLALAAWVTVNKNSWISHEFMYIKQYLAHKRHFIIMCCYHWYLLLVAVPEAVLQFNSIWLKPYWLTSCTMPRTGDSVLDDADVTSDCTEGYWICSGA